MCGDSSYPKVNGIDFRPATARDAPAIAETHLQAHRETYPPIIGSAIYRPPDLSERLAQWTEALAGSEIAYVATDHGRVVGFVHAKGDRIDTLYIRAAYHRRGIGRGLLTLVRRRLATGGTATVRFAVFSANAKAVAFYEAAGARCTGRLTVEEFGVSFEDLLFEISTDVG